MNKSTNFIILGTPRSGTTFFCETLNQQSNIWIPEFTNSEPFNPANVIQISSTIQTNLFDQNAIIEKLIDTKNKRNVEYFGFKTFLSWHNDISSVIDRHQLSIFLILRKNIWKVLASMLIAIDNKDFQGSSKRFEPFYYDGSNREQRRIFTIFNNLCRDYWWSENVFHNHANLIEKIYLEDLIENNISFEKVNNYFKKEIQFSANYTEDSIDEYVKNFEELKKFILEKVHLSKYHFSALPTYILQELEL
jgi:hypothetical protein